MATDKPTSGTDEVFAPERLTLMRERRGLSISQLARKSEVADKAVRNAEDAKTVPTDQSLERLAAALNVPVAFFFGPPIETLGENAASFRKASKLPAYRRRAALAAGALAMDLADYLAEQFDFSPVRIPDLAGTDPDTAAHAVRAAWGLGNGPAPNMVHLLESKGVFVTALAEDCRELDAFSFWRDGRPFVVLNPGSTVLLVVSGFSGALNGFRVPVPAWQQRGRVEAGLVNLLGW